MRAEFARRSLPEYQTTGRSRACVLRLAGQSPPKPSLLERKTRGEVCLRTDLPIMFHVYVIISESHPDRYYIGFSSRPDDRLTEHNSGKNPSTFDFSSVAFRGV